MIDRILGRKLCMTQVFNEAMEVVPVTVIEVGPCPVVQVKTPECDGYAAVQLGLGEGGRNVRKPQLGHFRRAGVKPTRYLREVRVKDVIAYKVGDEVTIAHFEGVRRVDVQGTTKGRGTTGTVKRHHFGGGPKTHGTKEKHRIWGSNGPGTFPGRVFKGKRMAGHHGSEKVTVRNLDVIRIDTERRLLFVHGAVPGANGGLVLVRMSERPEVANVAKSMA
ncbi:MAG: 50S ribosomal protein L3 [Planctomycetes bacterium]|nr:50S ribosomal protein L3 [Planctomycetota bacterium]